MFTHQKIFYNKCLLLWYEEQLKQQMAGCERKFGNGLDVRAQSVSGSGRADTSVVKSWCLLRLFATSVYYSSTNIEGTHIWDNLEIIASLSQCRHLEEWFIWSGSSSVVVRRMKTNGKRVKTNINHAIILSNHGVFASFLPLVHRNSGFAYVSAVSISSWSSFITGLLCWQAD